MLAAIRLDDQAMGEADEIDDIVVDGNLAAKLIVGEAVSTKDAPERALGVGGC